MNRNQPVAPVPPVCNLILLIDEFIIEEDLAECGGEGFEIEQTVVHWEIIHQFLNVHAANSNLLVYKLLHLQRINDRRPRSLFEESTIILFSLVLLQWKKATLENKSIINCNNIIGHAKKC